MIITKTPFPRLMLVDLLRNGDALFNVTWPDLGSRIISEMDRSWLDYQPAEL
jgi:hypothetical protein